MVQWNDGIIITAYELAKAGNSNPKIASALGLQNTTKINKLMLKYPALKTAVDKGRELYYKKNGQNRTTSMVTFSDFVFNQLPPKLQTYWDKLNRVNEDKIYVCQNCSKEHQIKPSKCKSCGYDLFTKRASITKIESLLESGGENVRKWLFLYAWACEFTFKLSKALQKVNISRSTFERWKDEDKEFKAMVDTVLEYKVDFIEEAAMDLVVMREPSIVKAMLQMLGRKRGYVLDEKTFNINNFEMMNNFIAIEQMGLPIEMEKMILERVRQQNTKQISSTVLDSKGAA